MDLRKYAAAAALLALHWAPAFADYTNVSGHHIHSPELSSDGPPPGATAHCRDGTYSFSEHHRGTCSGHHGVAEWIERTAPQPARRPPSHGYRPEARP